jgi:hypothetical protein
MSASSGDTLSTLTSKEFAATDTLFAARRTLGWTRILLSPLWRRRFIALVVCFTIAGAGNLLCSFSGRAGGVSARCLPARLAWRTSYSSIVSRRPSRRLIRIGDPETRLLDCWVDEAKENEPGGIDAVLRSVTSLRLAADFELTPSCRTAVMA